MAYVAVPEMPTLRIRLVGTLATLLPIWPHADVPGKAGGNLPILSQKTIISKKD